MKSDKILPIDRPIPRYALRRDEAAASLGISQGTFDNWIRDGIMPSGTKVRGVVLWDVKQIENAWRALMEKQEEEQDDGLNPFDEAVA